MIVPSEFRHVFFAIHRENRTGPIEDRIDRSFLVNEFRFRTKIALPITTLQLNLLMNQ